ncbi:unnamed protein product [Cochlearia groenlandica]
MIICLCTNVVAGKLPKHNNVTWRSDSCTKDGKDGERSFYKDLVGGYYDAGDAIKFNFPMSYAMTMLSWSVIEYNAKYKSAGELEHVTELIKWGTDYLLKTFNSSSDTINEIVQQVGSGQRRNQYIVRNLLGSATGSGNTITRGRSVVDNDHYCWTRPEDINYKRNVFTCNGGCTDLAAEMAAALASASIVFKDDMVYSGKLVRGAKALYKFAKTNVTYLAQVTDHVLARRAGAFYGGSSYYGVFSWDNKLLGAQLLLMRLRLFLSPGYPYEEILTTFHNQTGVVMCSYLPYFRKFKRTDGGLIMLNHGEPQPLQYVVNAAFLATLFSDYLDAVGTPGWYCGPDFYLNNVLREFSKSQIDYILGKNPSNISYVVGFGDRYPRHVHHRGASIPKNVTKVTCKGGWGWRDSKRQDPNVIVGAMVAGPDKEDKFHDVRENYNYTEPTLAGNAGLVAALVALSRGKTAGGFDRNTIFSAILPFGPETPPPPAPWTP